MTENAVTETEGKAESAGTEGTEATAGTEATMENRDTLVEILPIYLWHRFPRSQQLEAYEVEPILPILGQSSRRSPSLQRPVHWCHVTLLDT